MTTATKNLMSIENVKKVITIMAGIGNVAGKVMEDGKISIGDIMLLPSLVGTFVKLIEINWSEVVPEVKDISPEEIIQLIKTFKDEFNIPEKVIEEKIEELLDKCSQLVSVIFGILKTFHIIG